MVTSFAIQEAEAVRLTDGKLNPAPGIPARQLNFHTYRVIDAMAQEISTQLI